MTEIIKRDMFIDKLIYELDNIKEYMSIDTESVKDSRLKNIIKVEQKNLAKEYHGTVAELQLLSSMDKEGFMSSLGKAISGFFKALWKYIKKVIFFWKSDNSEEKNSKTAKGVAKALKDGIDMDKFPFQDIDELLLYFKTKTEFRDFFEYDKHYTYADYLDSLIDTTNLLRKIIVDVDLKMVKLDGVVIHNSSGEGRIKRFFKKLVEKKKPEIYVKHIGQKKVEDSYQAETIAFQVIDKKVIFISCSRFRPKVETTKETIEKLSDDKKLELFKKFNSYINNVGWSHQDFADYISSAEKIDGINEKITKTLEKLQDNIERLNQEMERNSDEITDKLTKSLKELYQKYDIRDYDNLDKNSDQAFFGQVKEAMKMVSIAVSEIQKQRAFSDKYIDVWDKYLKAKGIDDDRDRKEK